MNTTKWNELRLEMYQLMSAPAWTTVYTDGGHSRPDVEWYYHFRTRGYASILYVDILVENAEQREIVRSALRRIHVPGAETPEGFRVFGYLRDGQVVDYL